MRNAYVWTASTLVGLFICGCGSDLPHDNGVKWDCFGQVRDCPKGVEIIGAPPNQPAPPPRTPSEQECIGGFISPTDIPITICADPTVPEADVKKACEEECKDKFRTYGLFSKAPFFFSDVDSCPIQRATPRPRERCEDPPPPEFLNGGPSDLRLDISGTAHIDVDGHSANTTASGTLDLSIEPCAEPQCKVRISRVYLTAASFEIAGKPVDQVVLENKGITVGTWTRATGAYELPNLSMAIGIIFRVDGDEGSITLRNNTRLQGSVHADGTAFHVAGSFNRDKVTASFDITGNPIQHPPIAGFTPNGGTVECNAEGGAVVHFASTARDPDGDLRAVEWSLDGGDDVSGNAIVRLLPLGDHRIEQSVRDARGAIASQTATITVIDTTAPTLGQPPDAVIIGCQDDGAVADIAVPTTRDVCGTSTVTATVVDVNGVPTSTPYVSGYRFRQGTTTLRFDAVDPSGNRSSVLQHVIVERGAACCPHNVTILSGTAQNDTLRGGNHAQCIDGLSGDDAIDPGNSGDIVFAGLGADVVRASNAGDTIYGGNGADHLIGGNGADVLWGGAGDDHLEGGNGPDVLRGGAGKDLMEGGNGPDRFIIAAACEAVPGEIVRGGEGNDTVESPLTREELEARGVILEDIENVVVVPQLASRECP